MMNKQARPSLAVEGKTIVNLQGYCVLSTLASDGSGFPSASQVGYAASADDGLPILALSSMSSHTKDICADNRVSILCLNGTLQHADESRITLSGYLEQLTGNDARDARSTYLAKHPNAFWVDFGDFAFYKLTSLRSARVVAGFGAAGSISADEYAAAEVDPVAPYSTPIAQHMNEDHLKNTLAMVKHFCGFDATNAVFDFVDSYGFDVRATDANNQTFRFRIGFNNVARDRKAVKDEIVELSKEAEQQKPSSE